MINQPTYNLLVIIMSWEKDLTIQQLDETMQGVRGIQSLFTPRNSWISALRQGLGMSARQFGERLGISQPGVVRLEKSEASGSITLKTLERAAAGLGCRVVYAIVPEGGTLADMRMKQARKKAEQVSAYTQGHMALEDQATDANFRQQSINLIADDYLKKWPRDFWDDE